MGEISVGGRVSWACLNSVHEIPSTSLAVNIRKEITKLLLGASRGERGHLLFSFVFPLVRVEPS